MLRCLWGGGLLASSSNNIIKANAAEGEPLTDVSQIVDGYYLIGNNEKNAYAGNKNGKYLESVTKAQALVFYIEKAETNSIWDFHILLTEGYYIPDGTQLRITITDSSGRSFAKTYTVRRYAWNDYDVI